MNDNPPAVDITTRDRIAADALRWAADRIDPGPRNSRPAPSDETQSITMSANRGAATNLRFWADQIQRGHIEPRPAGSEPHATTDARDPLDEVVRIAVFAADTAVMNGRFRTHAEETRAAVRAAFELAVGNGLIRLTPLDEWPKDGIVLTPPYAQRLESDRD